MFFNKKGKKAIRIIWIVLSVMVILSMTLLYIPSLFS